MSQRSVIAATDLSERSAHVAGRGAHLARVLGASLILVHVGPDDSPTRFAPLGRGRRQGDPEVRLRALAERHQAQARLLRGNPAEVLAALAATHDAALLVLGLHRERRVLDLLRLTTMERVVLASPCPVLIAHQPPDQAYAQVLALTDFSSASAEALAMAARIAPAARFHAVHALPVPLGAALTRGNRDTEAALARAEQEKQAFLAHPGLPVLTEPPEIVPGGVHQILAFRQAELAADLVCIGAQSQRDPAALGEYARDLMRAPPTDLLVAKARQAATRSTRNTEI